MFQQKVNEIKIIEDAARNNGYNKVIEQKTYILKRKKKKILNIVQSRQKLKKKNVTNTP